MNLALHVGDQKGLVHHNRRQLQKHIDVNPIFINQVHGIDITLLDIDSTSDYQIADAAFTTQKGIACSVLTADCLPVFFATTHENLVAIAHAGWRGLAAGILEKTLSVFQEKHIIKDNIYIWLGPCIGPSFFIVDHAVLQAFWSVDPKLRKKIIQCFQPYNKNKYQCSLGGIARARLEHWGITPDKIYGNKGYGDWCTFSNSQQFFSYRRDQKGKGATGRMANCIWCL
jgi:YfiH family protein